MNIIIAVLFLAAGLALLWKGAELLVAGAVGLARRLGISSLVIGLTIVAMGTSAPELAASIAGVLQKSKAEVNTIPLETQTGVGEPGEQINSVEEGGNLAIGNVFGSNIANLALIGGLVALIQPLVVQRQTLRREIPVMILMELFLWPFLCNMHLSRLEAFTLIMVFTILILITIHLARKESGINRHKQAEPDKLDSDNIIGSELITRANGEVVKSGEGIKNVVFIVIALIGLAVGAKMAVEGAVFIGKLIGLSKSIIALTIIAFGTSLPELVTCVVAAFKGHHDISIGNLVGSNIFNTLLVVGGTGIVLPFDIEQRFAGGADYWIMIIISIAFALMAVLGRRIINRLSGLLLVCGYFVYIAYLLYNR